MHATGHTYHVVASASEQLEVCLGNIRLLAGMMLDERQTGDREQHHDYLRTIERKARHLLHVTADLGDFAQLGLRRRPLIRTELHLSELAEQAIEALTPLAVSQQRLLVLAVSVGEPRILADYRKLLQALGGLLRHCLTIAVPAAQILLAIRPGPATLRLEIDVPVDPEPTAAETPSQRLSEARDEDGGELAAALTAQVCELHGGSLRALHGERHQRYVLELPLAAA